MRDFFEDKVNFYMILEQQSSMTLREHVVKYRARFDIARQQVLLQTLGGSLEFLHANGIVMRALDPQGILMSESSVAGTTWDGGNALPLIARLSHATVMNIDDDQFTVGCFGDPHFRAPEVLGGQPYTYKADVWSFGVLAYWILTGQLPFSLKTQADMGSDDSSSEEILQESDA